ncbi:MAG: proline dehydrogenase family protein [Candidatus Limnocylindrales bacterium]
MRTLLLWLARSTWLRDRIPRLPFARRAVRRFMPGEAMEAALDAAAGFRAQRIGVIFTRLGENVTRDEEADATADHYLTLLDAASGREMRAELSVKLTQLGLDLDEDRTFARLTRLAESARRDGGVLWIDMEGSAYTERTVALYERLVRAGQTNVGLCLQAYLRRTAGDVQRLLPLRPAIRLVKGAYDEPPSIAYRTRRSVDANYAALATTLLGARAAGQQLRIALATHDVDLVEQLAGQAAALGLMRDAFEVQMLYGIRPDQQRRLARDGFVVRVLIAYGPAWYAWYLRRLAERPANVVLALRQMVP